ncbi:TPA: hypothetical protein ACOA77_000245 [Enterococcus faecium]|uniref:Uncharacterized protein n=1 Tax=Enterococcus faecium TaxID=1352 RepID=A0A7T8QZW6_ENTFC|nr:hypothetical protein [Enterococcus faecium]MBX9129897.1 hypothetical protein [Enterococcus faecium]MBX9134331.1 hypothetical protein [Enterococcus faecium]MBY3637201.1 hypothetical protein [Enterococcus faecium]MBY3669576.1 hypothetical protein [Enterococcus faecium]MCZ1554420.1 hypothetical protein [Enterococcus faecium]
MSVFNNKVMLGNCYVNHIGFYDGGTYRVLFLRLSVFSYSKDGKRHYENINAQISCPLDRNGETTTTSSHPKALMNKFIFEKLDRNLVEGMKISIHGNIRGTEQVLLNSGWKNFGQLSPLEKEEYQKIPKNELVTRNQTYIYIEEVSMPEKEEFRKSQSKVTKEDVEVAEPNQADEILSDDTDPVNDEGEVIEVFEAEIIEEEEEIKSFDKRMYREKPKGYVNFEDMYYDEYSNEPPIN